MAQHIKTGTTVANTVTRLTFTSWATTIEILNSGGSDIWARVDTIDPVIGADDCVYVPAGTWVSIADSSPSANSDIRVISAAATNFTISAGV